MVQVGVLAIMPILSFAQSYECVTGTIGSNGNVDWSNTYCYAVWDGAGGYGGWDAGGSENDDDDYDLPNCGIGDKDRLRNKKSSLDNCYGDPGDTYDVSSWFQLGNIPFDAFHYILQNTFNETIQWFTAQLASTNGNLTMLHDDLFYQLWIDCEEQFAISSWEIRECRWSVETLARTYYPGTITEIFQYMLNWLPGPKLDASLLTNNWASSLNNKVQNYQQCHEVFEEWDDLGCSGTF